MLKFNASNIESLADFLDGLVDKGAPLIASVFPEATAIKDVADLADHPLDEVLGSPVATPAVIASATASKAQLATAVAAGAAAAITAGT